MNSYVRLGSICIFLAGVTSFTAPKKSVSFQQIQQQAVSLLDSSVNLYAYENFYISGQPTDSIFRELLDLGLKKVICIRTEGEMMELKAEGFDEAHYLDSLGIQYINVPMGGEAGYQPLMIEQINEAIDAQAVGTMIHCRGAGRASMAYVAWLINFQQVPINEAIMLGKQMRLNFAIEELLGYSLFFDKER